MVCIDCCREGHIPNIVACGSLHEFLCKAHKQYGPIVSFWLGPKMFVSLGSAKLFAQQADVFDRSCKLRMKNVYVIFLMPICYVIFWQIPVWIMLIAFGLLCLE